MTRGPAARLAAMVLTAALFAVGTAVCVKDDRAGTDAARTAADRSTTTSRAALEAYCTAALGFATLEPPEIDDALAEEEQATQRLQYASATLKPAADDLAQSAPEGISSDVDVVVAAVEQLAASGAPEDYDNDTVDLARKRLHQFDLEECGLASEQVTMADFSYSGVEALPAGSVSIDASNQGEEYHELAVIVKRPGVTRTFEEILALDDPAEQQRYATYVGGVEPVAPGDTGFTVVDLRAGDYLMACFLSVGSTPELFETGDPIPGPPHVARGMTREFKVS